jgi:photosystem II stability/assembly factor-like uncharacterized protein
LGKNVSTVCLIAVLATPLFASEANIRESRIVWQPNLSLKMVERIFPSPHDPSRVLIATRDGLAQTLDDGQTWTLLPNTGRETLGRLSDLCYSPYDENNLCLGTKDKGVFRSKDGGKTWANAGRTENGLISLRVVRVVCQPGDRCFNTFYALHGEDVLGMSKTLDGGKRWSKIAEQGYFSDLLFSGSQFVTCGCLTDEPDVWRVANSRDGGKLWYECARNKLIYACAASRIDPDRQWFGVQGGGILRSDDWEVCGPESGNWRSFFTTFGERSDKEVLFAYDPHAQGLLMSKDRFGTWVTENDGLFIHRLIKEGANVCAPATGATFYASINGQLYIGRRIFPNVPNLSRPKTSPSVVRVPYHGYLAAAGELQAKLRAISGARHAGSTAVTLHKTIKDLSQWSASLGVYVTVRVTPDETRKVASVTIDLSPLLGPDKAEMFDDGKHNDGAANDGVYGLSVPVPPRCLDRYAPNDKGPKLPGQTALNLTAVDSAGAASHGVVLLSVHPCAENMLYWNGDSARWGFNMTHMGECRIAEFENAGRTGKGLRIRAEKGPWSCGWGADFNPKNVSDQGAFTFWIKAPPAPGRDIKFALQDAPYREYVASFSNEIWLIKDGYLKERKDEYQQVRIPMSKLLSLTGFQTDQCGGFAFGGNSPEGDDFYVDDLGFETEGGSSAK